MWCDDDLHTGASQGGRDGNLTYGGRKGKKIKGLQTRLPLSAPRAIPAGQAAHSSTDSSFHGATVHHNPSSISAVPLISQKSNQVVCAFQVLSSALRGH